MSNSLDPDQARQIVELDLGPKCLPMLSAEDTGRQRANNLCKQFGPRLLSTLIVLTCKSYF